MSGFCHTKSDVAAMRIVEGIGEVLHEKPAARKVWHVPTRQAPET